MTFLGKAQLRGDYWRLPPRIQFDRGSWRCAAFFPDFTIRAGRGATPYEAWEKLAEITIQFAGHTGNVLPDWCIIPK